MYAGFFPWMILDTDLMVQPQINLRKATCFHDLFSSSEWLYNVVAKLEVVFDHNFYRQRGLGSSIKAFLGLPTPPMSLCDLNVCLGPSLLPKQRWDPEDRVAAFSFSLPLKEEWDNAPQAGGLQFTSLRNIGLGKKGHTFLFLYASTFMHELYICNWLLKMCTINWPTFL